MAGLVDLVGKEVTGKDGAKDVASIASDVKAVGVYFSAHWCPPCRGFTPVLAEFYNEINKDGKKFEVIFVSSDRDDASFNEYYGEMPWLALPFSDRAKKDELAQKYGVRGIPTLVILKPNGETVSQNGRGDVQAFKSEGKVPAWLS